MKFTVVLAAFCGPLAVLGGIILLIVIKRHYPGALPPQPLTRSAGCTRWRPDRLGVAVGFQARPDRQATSTRPAVARRTCQLTGSTNPV
jgi:hypothetical protein